MNLPTFSPFCRLCFCILWGTGIADGENVLSHPAARWQGLVTDQTREVRDLACVPGGHERQKLDLYLPREGSAKVSTSTAVAGPAVTRASALPNGWFCAATP